MPTQQGIAWAWEWIWAGGVYIECVLLLAVSEFLVAIGLAHPELVSLTAGRADLPSKHRSLGAMLSICAKV